MRLDEYQWSRNPRGLHVQRVLITPLEVSRWTTPHFGWVKMVASEYEYVDDAMEFLAAGVTPVVRIYRARWGARPFDREMRQLTTAYIEAGVKWFELYNEPNQGIEWPEGSANPDWRNIDGVIRPLMDNWIVWADYIASLGCYPGFPALAESDTESHAAVRWMNTFLNYLYDHHYHRFRNVLAGGMYVATHPYLVNHFYQETPGGGARSARSPADQNGEERGWHFEYPYDPICQANDPGRTVYGGTELTPHGDPVGLLAMGRMFNERAAAMFDSQFVPVLGTEGGIFPFRNGPHRQDTRYPAYDEASQAEATVAMFDWIARRAPPWFLGLCLWKEDEYYLSSGSQVPAIDRLTEVDAVGKDIPALNVMADNFTPVPLSIEGEPLIGPGPIHGTPDLHVVILGDGLDTSWFFDTAQAYWNTFRPIVVTSPEVIDLTPWDKSMAATIIAPPANARAMREQLQGEYPNLWIDVIQANSREEIADIFNIRVARNLRFG